MVGKGWSRDVPTGAGHTRPCLRLQQVSQVVASVHGLDHTSYG